MTNCHVSVSRNFRIDKTVQIWCFLRSENYLARTCTGRFIRRFSSVNLTRKICHSLFIAIVRLLYYYYSCENDVCQVYLLIRSLICDACHISKFLGAKIYPH